MTVFSSPVLQSIKDTLFPVFCLSCAKEGNVLCTECLHTISVDGVFLCPICGVSNSNKEVCLKCLDVSFLTKHIALGVYNEKNLFSRLIHELKYNYNEETVPIFSTLFSHFFTHNKDLFQDIDCIIPVPLHPRRYAERGFNQSEFVSHIVSYYTNIPVEKSLKRVKFTQTQVKLNKVERKINVQNAFAVTKEVGGKNILLVDDVFTTGSTMQECAQALKLQGARCIQGFSLARAV